MKNVTVNWGRFSSRVNALNGRYNRLLLLMLGVRWIRKWYSKC